jgi:outer membrane lipoprotein SlyB
LVYTQAIVNFIIKLDNPMIKDNTKITQQITEIDELVISAEGDAVKLIRRKFLASDLVNKVGNFEKKLVIQSSKLPREMKTLASHALDLAKHPSRYAQLGASLVEGMAGQSLGGTIGAGLGTVFGPGGTVIGAELGSLMGGVLGARQGSKIAKRFAPQTETDHPFKEDLEKESSGKFGAHAGKMIGGMIGNALFDDAGNEIGEAVGDKIGSLAGNFAFKRLEKIHTQNHNESSFEDASSSNTNLS